MTTASILSTVSVALSAALAVIRAVEAYNQGSGSLAVNPRSGAPAGGAPESAPPTEHA